MTPFLAFLWVLWTPVYEILVRTLVAQHTTSVYMSLLFVMADAKCVLFKSHDLNVPSSVQIFI